MAYRWNGVECDTFEELQRLQGSARTTSAVVKETRKSLVCGARLSQTDESRTCGKGRLHKGECKEAKR